MATDKEAAQLRRQRTYVSWLVLADLAMLAKIIQIRENKVDGFPKAAVT